MELVTRYQKKRGSKPLRKLRVAVSTEDMYLPKFHIWVWLRNTPVSPLACR